MVREADKPADASPNRWSSIYYLKIYKEGDSSPNPPVYFFGNGRQKCKIYVELVAHDATGKPVTLTAAELASHVKLIAYSGGDLLGVGQYAGWLATTAANEYIWDEGFARQFAPLEQIEAENRSINLSFKPAVTGGQTIAFYVSSDRAGDLSVAVRVTNVAGTAIAMTNWPSAGSGDGYGDGNGKFNSSVNLRAQRFVLPSVHAYGLKVPGDDHLLMDHLKYGPKGDDRLRAYEQYIELTYMDRSFSWRYAARHDTGSMDFSVWYSIGKGGAANWSLTYVVQPGETKYRFFSSFIGYLVGHSLKVIPTILETCVPSYGPNSKRVVIGQVMADFDHDIADWNFVVRQAPERNLVLVDEYGNEHYLRLYLPEGKLNYVAIDTFTPTLPAKSLAPYAVSVNKINIVPQQTKIYANGRQQIRVAITVELRVDGQPSPLTTDEVSSIKLLNYETGEELYTDPSGWRQDPAFSGYDFFPGEPGSFALPDAPGDTAYAYLSAGSATVSTPLKLAFSIFLRNESVYTSTGYYTPAGGSPIYDPAYDIKDNITATAVTPVRYLASQCRLSRSPLPASTREGAHAALFNDRVELHIEDGTGAVVRIRDMHCEPVGMIHWEKKTTDDHNPCFTGYARPGGTEVHWDPAIFEAVQPVPGLPSAAAPDRGTFLLCGRVDLPYEKHSGLHQDRIRVTLIDGYGSDQVVTLEFVERSRDELTIS